MKKNNKKKLASVLAVLAVSATSLLGTLSFTGCGEKSITGDTGSTQISAGAATYQISTVYGARTVATSGKTYYVSPDGTGAGTEASPANILTLLDGTVDSNKKPVANTSVQPGDTIILKDGTYNLTSTLHLFTSGTYDQPITIKAENSGKAILSCYGQVWGSRGVQLEADYINFIGITVCGSGDNGLHLSGDHNLVEDCDFYDNRDTGLQIGRYVGDANTVESWPSYNLVKNCTSHNNYDNETYGENADGFAAKLTLGYGNVFDGCISYRNSDDGWDLYAKNTSGNLGAVMIYNCVAFENGFLEYTQAETNARYGSTFDTSKAESNTNSYSTADGDGNGFKLGGEAMEGDVFVYNCLSFGNRMHGFTDNSNPGYLSLKYCTAVDNGAVIDDDSTSATFGKVINPTDSTSHANFDISRQTYSYNHIDHSVSVVTAEMGKGLVYDKVRGSAQYTYLYGTSTDTTHSYKIETSIDADTKNTITGTSAALLSASDIFEKTQVTTTTTGEGESATTTTTYNISGKGSDNATTSIHNALRNDDGSINMGDLYKIKDYSKLFGDDNKIGANLTGTSYEDYTHFNMTDFTEFTDDVDVILHSAKDMLYIETDENAVYQDFEAVSKIFGCVVMWSSSDEDILSVSKTYTGSSLSKAEYVPIIVTRPAEDTSVTLTATINYYGQTITKDFVLNVVGDSPKIGDIVVIGPDGEELSDGQSIIVDKYTVLSDPQMIVYNAADYSGKQITSDQATFTTTYEFGEDIASFAEGGSSTQVKGFTTAQDGAFKITMSVKLTVGANKGASVDFTYYVVVASNTANIKFLNDEYTLNVNAQGYQLSGNLTSAIGTIYSYASDTELSAENKTAAYIMANGAQYTFRATSLTHTFANANEGAYYTYTVFTNGNGEVTSKIYETKVEVVEVSTAQAFYDLAQANTTSLSTKIYVLTTDLDFTGFDYKEDAAFTAETKGFTGLFTGNGHTISNITINAGANADYVGVFRSLLGGTVTNVKFNNIAVTGQKDKIGGIFGAIMSGNVSKVAITNISVLAGASVQRVGGLAGQIFSNNSAVSIDQVSIINDTTAAADGSYTYQIGGANATARVGALVGFAQTSSAQLYMDITISNCYVKAIVGGNANGDYVGGILGRYDDRNGDGLDNLVITNCYSDCVMMGAKRTGGIYGGGTGSGSLTVTGCVFTGTMLNGSGAVVTTSSSNNASIIGSHGTANATKLAAYFADNSFKNATTILTADSIKLAATWTALDFDLTIWTLDTTNGGLTLTFAA